MDQSAAPRKTTRREFTRTALLAALAAPAACTPAAHPAPAPSAPRPAPATLPANPEADALFALARQRYGRHLDAEQIEQLRRNVETYLRNAERLRAAPLRQAEEPSFVFRVIGGEV